MNDEAATIGAVIVLANYFYWRTSRTLIPVLIVPWTCYFSFVVRVNVETFVFDLSCLRYFFAKWIRITQHRQLLNGVALRLIRLQ
jgi:hypothetical protein